MITGSAVELSDELAGRGEHDRVESDGSVGNPSGEGILGDLGEITDMNSAMIEIEAEGGFKRWSQRWVGLTVVRGRLLRVFSS